MQVEKVINCQLKAQYDLQKITIEEENNGNSNEVLLFHGSPSAHLICEKGFDIKMSSANGFFGAGKS